MAAKQVRCELWGDSRDWQPRISARDYAFLDFLRRIHLSCRTKPRTTLFEACALLHSNRSKELDAHAEALMRCLSDAFRKSARLHAPGTVELSFDERWLLQLGTAVTANDEASVAFLVHSRISAEHRRLIRFLMGRIAQSFDCS